jgi:CBS domain-containing protein
MKAKDVMSTHVVSVTPETTVPEIASKLMAHRISAVPVVDRDGKLVGIVSEGDLFRRPEIGAAESGGSCWLAFLKGDERLAQSYVKTHGRRAAEVMTTKVVTAAEGTPIDEIAALLETHHIKRVPIVRDGRPVGIVSRANLVQALATARPTLVGIEPSDEAIRAKIMDELGRQAWANLITTNVVVKGGVVEFWGLVTTEAVKSASRVVAENVRGVRKVIDRRSPLALVAH